MVFSIYAIGYEKQDVADLFGDAANQVIINIVQEKEDIKKRVLYKNIVDHNASYIVMEKEKEPKLKNVIREFDFYLEIPLEDIINIAKSEDEYGELDRHLEKVYKNLYNKEFYNWEYER